MVLLERGIRRITLPLPFGIDHVHCYLLPVGDGFVLVDTGLGTRDPEARWRPVLDELPAPVERIVITHMHPDHVGGAADAAVATGAPVSQGREDHAQCLAAWGQGRASERYLAHWGDNGMPAEDLEEIATSTDALVSAVHWSREVDPLEPGDAVGEWRVELLRGHADGHIALLHDGVLIAGDTILDPITPAIGVYPDSRPDPLGDYFATLRRIEELAPRIAYCGHGHPIEDPGARAVEIREHHVERLERTLAALDGEPRTAYDVSLVLFDQPLGAVSRRFALAEALAHLDHLCAQGTAVRSEGRYLPA